MQSDDLFIRKFRRQSPRPSLAGVTFESKREPLIGTLRGKVVAEWPPRKEGEEKGSGIGSGALRSAGRSHVMQRSNSDVTLGDLEVSGKVGGSVDGGDKLQGGPALGEQDVVLHREYGSLSSLERQSRARAQSSDDQGALSPPAQRFKDPFLLLGLQAGGAEPDSYFRALTPSVVKPNKSELQKKPKSQPQLQPCNENLPGGAWVRNFAHYDVQSILFDLIEAASNRDSIGRKKNITSGASAASQLRSPALPAPPGGGDGNDNELLLSCPHFRNELGGEERAGLGQSQARSSGQPCQLQLNFQCPNDAVSVLEEPRESHIQQQGKTSYFIEHADLGAHYYRKYFYMKVSHTNTPNSPLASGETEELPLGQEEAYLTAEHDRAAQHETNKKRL
ncbi:Signal-induced proliferation-associated 1-like protein 2 [Acipenser ruthenus]|uniref:Signal-induced proliferation-associated 1-like protein 2 n=1 Tax=Acipenser ruthenus TaxID=7906 RepID=A0A444V3K4_ACIRT|nr:Signal-induced proliferation-associated 1-like protein 2 [Acipenser ruthenus]